MTTSNGMKYLTDIQDLSGKKVLLRTDFDVPVSEDGIIQEKFRIEKQKEAVDYLLDRKAIVVMVAHISDENVKSFRDLVPQFQEMLGHQINYFDALDDLEDLKVLKPGFVGIFHKIRDYEGEQKNDIEFARKLSEGFDIYVNNDFAVSHRNHASVSAVTKFLPSYAGPVIEHEVNNLRRGLESPSENKVIIIGGAKGQTKLPVVKNFLNKAEKVLVGGIVANDIILAKGLNLEVTNVDQDFKELLSGLDLNHPALVLPEDYVFKGGKILDIGPNSIDNFVGIIKNAKMIIWNGPLGLFEKQDFSSGTFAVARAIAESSAFKIVGGGDTITVIDQLGIRDKFNFVSTGGGAMLYFLSGQKLPGLEGLKYYE